MSKTAKAAVPDFEAGVAYWSALPATLDAVLGGYASGPLPWVDALSSRQLILSNMPHLRTFPSAHNPNPAPPPSPPARAVDVGAGIGRVTSSVLLNMFTFVDVVEPVESFLHSAMQASTDWQGIREDRTGVRFLKGGLQTFDPSSPSKGTELLGQRGRRDEAPEGGYDLIWCQWCLGHLTNKGLVAFLKRAKRGLRKGGFVVVKENLCDDGPQGEGKEAFDELDSSLTRSNRTWLDMFDLAGLEVVREEIQDGFPAELFEVKSYVLSRPTPKSASTSLPRAYSLQG